MPKPNKYAPNYKPEQKPISLYVGGPVAHEMHPRNTMGLMTLQRECGKAGIPFKWKIVHGSSILPDARNIVCAQFLESDATHLFMVDADIEFQGIDVLRAIVTGKDIVGLPCAKRQANFELAAEVLRKYPEIPGSNLPAYIGGMNFLPLNEKTQPEPDMTLKVTHVGTGAMVVSRKALEKFIAFYPDRWYKNTITGQDLKEFFRFWTNPETKEQWGEDYGFCVDMRNAGVDVHVLIDAKTIHYGSFGFEADFSKLAAHYIKDVEVENG